MNKASESSYYYKTGGALNANEPTYIERESDKFLFEKLIRGEYCYVFNPRQLGKSSLLNRIKADLEKVKTNGKQNICAVLDLSRLESETELKWYKTIINRLYKEFKKYNLAQPSSLKKWYQENQNQDLPNNNLLETFLETTLQKNLDVNLFIFIDEIDSVLNLHFSTDAFFMLIRYCQNRGASDNDYQRLTFAIFGVLNVYDLIKSKDITPFNTAQSIELSPFKFQEDNLKNFKKGLENATNVVDADKVLESVFEWTNGQPFLTQKLCRMICEYPEKIIKDQEKEIITQLVHETIIKNWEKQDSPQHLQTIIDRFYRKPDLVEKMLFLYQDILKQGEIKFEKEKEYEEIKLSGLVIQEKGYLRVYNKIYQNIFNEDWVKEKLTDFRLSKNNAPYEAQFKAWKADTTDKSRLLRGKALKEAEKYIESNFSDLTKEQSRLSWIQKKLTNFLLSRNNAPYEEQFEAWKADTTDKSRLLRGKALQEAEKYIKSNFSEVTKESSQLSIEQSKTRLFIEQSKTNQLQTEIKRYVSLGSISLLILSTLILWLQLKNKSQEFQAIIEDTANAAITQFQSQELDSLKSAMLAVKGLKDVSRGQNNLESYTSNTPLVALQSILDQIREYAQLNINQEGRITKIDFHPWLNDNNSLIIGTDNGSILQWDIQEKKSNKIDDQSHQHEITALEFSPDATYSVSADSSGKALVRRWFDSKIINLSKENSGGINSIGISSDEELIAIGKDNKIEIWNKNGRLLKLLEDEDPKTYGQVDAIAFIPMQTKEETQETNKKGTMITAYGNGSIKVWNYIKSGNNIEIDYTYTKKTAHKELINDLKFSSDGKFIISAGKDGTIKIWEFDQQKKLIKLIKSFTEHQDSVLSFDFSKDSKLLATASQDETVILWNMSNLKNPTFLTQLKGHKGSVTNVNFSPNGKLLATTGQDGTIRLWDLSKLELLDLEKFSQVTFSPDRKTMAAFNEEGKVSIWKEPFIENNSLILSESNSITTLPLNNRCEEKISSFAFQDNNKIILGTEQGNICIFDTLGTFQDDQPWQAHENSRINSITVDPNQPKFFVTASDKGELIKWSLDGQQHSLEKRKECPDECFFKLFFDSKENFLLTTTKEDKLKIYDNNLEGENIFDSYIDFSQNQDYLVIVTNNKIEIFKSSDVSTPVKELEPQELGLGKVLKVRFSPDNQYLAIVEQSGHISIWEIADFVEGKVLQPPLKIKWKGHIHQVTNIAFSPDGQILATADQPEETKNGKIKNNGTVKLWNWKWQKLDKNKPQSDLYIDAEKLQIAEFQGSNFYFGATERYEEQPQIIIEKNKGLIVEPIKTLDELLKEGCQWLKLNELDSDIKQFC